MGPAFTRGRASPESRQALVDNLADSALRGAKGVKVWKDLGLTRRDATGELVLPDDPRVIEVLGVAGDLGLPVLIHTADPVAFFEPLDRANERWDELAEMPSWWFGAPEFPSFNRLIDALHTLVAACPQTTFVGAHVGGHAENLAAVGEALHRLAKLQRRHRGADGGDRTSTACLPSPRRGIPRPGALWHRLLPD
ncbi:MAG: amidohydrolase family protein [Marmoricola sp.]